MTVIINPGSGAVHSSGEGWTNTEAGARREAAEWLRRMRESGIRGVALLSEVRDTGEGRWVFQFRHVVSGVVVELETHGIDNLDAYRKEAFLGAFPRVYWKGSSSADPEVEDWSAPGFEVVKTLRKAETT